MMYSWLPSMTLCMSMLSNNSSGPLPRAYRNLDRNTATVTRYLGAANTLIQVAARTLASTAGRNVIRDRIDDNEVDVESPGFFKCSPTPIDCEELLKCGFRQSGIYRIFPQSRLNTWGEAGFDVFCDMVTDGGGWTVIQRRDDVGSNPDNFFKNWQEYKDGFGDPNYEYWLGNNKIYALSNQRRCNLRIDLSDFSGDTGHAIYDNFYLQDESEGYKLHIGDYRGNVGDSLRGHNLCKFSTMDRDQDKNAVKNCAQLYKGGWWYNNCHTANLNGLYLRGDHDSYANGVNWYEWKGFKYSLMKTEMKLRSSGFTKPLNVLDAPTPPDATATILSPR